MRISRARHRLRLAARRVQRDRACRRPAAVLAAAVRAAAAAARSSMLSGWYVRGDLGYRFNELGSVDASAAGRRAAATPTRFAVGGGVGYKYELVPRRPHARLRRARTRFDGNAAGRAAALLSRQDRCALGPGERLYRSRHLGRLHALRRRRRRRHAICAPPTTRHFARRRSRRCADARHWNFSWAGWPASATSSRPNLRGRRRLPLSQARRLPMNGTDPLPSSTHDVQGPFRPTRSGSAFRFLLD